MNMRIFKSTMASGIFPCFFRHGTRQKIGVKNQMKLRAASLRGII
jgi:hypothetical protein